MDRRKLLTALALGAGLAFAAPARAATELHMMWYSDGGEGQVMKDLLARFEKANPDVKVTLDEVPYKAIQESLPVQLAAGKGPDLARVTNVGGLAQYYLDLRPYLKDAGYFDKNFGPFLGWMRQPGDKTSIPGIMTQLTVTGAFINKTLFDQAKVAVPGPGTTWDQWAKTVKEVADKTKTPYPLAMDRSGHRFMALAMSMGAKLFDAKGNPAVIDDGFKAAAQRIADWHKSGIMPKEIWGAVSGSTYRGANDEFKNGQVVMYFSGSWQIAQFSKTIGADFDWQAVPEPCGPAACTGMPGGAALVALKTTTHPKEVARLIDYLASEPVLSEFYARSLFIPGHLGLASKGLDYKTTDPQAKAALNVFASDVGTLSPVAYEMQGYNHNFIVFNAVISRLGQVVVGEMTLDEAYKRIADDIKQQIAEADKKK